MVLTYAMLIFSHLYFRRLAYETFLVLHILLAVFVITGCWYHVILNFGYNFYDNRLYAACAVWFFDRLLCVLRIANNGVRRAIVIEIGADYERIDLQGVRWASKAGYFAYAYSSALNLLRPWEKHPFSINSTALFRSCKHALVPTSTLSEHSLSTDGRDMRKQAVNVSGASVVHDVDEIGGRRGVR